MNKKNIIIPLILILLASFLIIGFYKINIIKTIDNFANLRTYYVSPTGSDINPGTKEAPFKTFEKLISVISDGDTGYLMQGEYYVKNTATIKSKTLKNGIKISSYPGQRATIKSSLEDVEMQKLIWVDEGNGIYSAQYSSNIPANYWIAGYTDTKKSLFTHRTLASLTAGPEGILFLNNKIYLKLANNANPRTQKISISSKPILNIDGINGVGIKIKDINFEWSQSAIQVYNSNNISIINNEIIAGLKPIDVRYSSNVLIENNKVQMTRSSSWGWTETKTSIMETTAIWLQNNYEGIIVNHNEIFGHFNGILLFSENIGYFKDAKITKNMIHDIYDDGIEIEDYANGYLIEKNKLYDVFVAISVSPANSDQKMSMIKDNQILANKQNLWDRQLNTSTRGEVFKIQTSNRFSNWNITGNIMYGAIMYTDGYSRNKFNLIIENNVLFSKDQLLIRMSGLASDGVYFNNNIYYREDTGAIFRYWNSETNSQEFRTLSNAKASLSWDGTWDTNSQNVKPAITISNINNLKIDDEIFIRG